MGFGFLGGHRRHHLGSALAGLGALTARGSNGPSKEATRVVGSFVRGIRAQGACKKTKGRPAGPCEITTDGVKLKVGRTEVGVRHDDRTVSVCIPHKADMVTDKKGNTVEAQDSKDIRATAAALLRVLGAGIGIRTDKAGLRRIVGRRGISKTAVPETDGCFEVHISPRMYGEASLMMQAASNADAEHGGPGKATKAQINAAAKKIRKARKDAAIAARKAAAAAAKAAKAAASAPPAARTAASTTAPAPRRRGRRTT